MGRFFRGGTLSQALRARLRSHRPSGTKNTPNSPYLSAIRNPGRSPIAPSGLSTSCYATIAPSLRDKALRAALIGRTNIRFRVKKLLQKGTSRSLAKALCFPGHENQRHFVFNQSRMSSTAQIWNQPAGSSNCHRRGSEEKMRR
jgi:hypothetical protein